MITDCAIGHHRLISFIQTDAKHSSAGLCGDYAAQSRLSRTIAVLMDAMLYVQQFIWIHLLLNHYLRRPCTYIIYKT